MNSDGTLGTNKNRRLLDFLFKLERLKNIPRIGWALRGVLQADVESVAEHSNLVGLIALIIGAIINKKNAKIRLDIVARLALLHDIPEVIMGDIDRSTNRLFGTNFSEVKLKVEERVMKELILSLDSETQHALGEFWLEYYTDSVEKRIVNLADRIEASIQALIYIEKGYSKAEFRPFFDNLEKQIETLEWPEIKPLLTEICSQFNGA